jgi:hypothetical protein
MLPLMIISSWLLSNVRFEYVVGDEENKEQSMKVDFVLLMNKRLANEYLYIKLICKI